MTVYTVLWDPNLEDDFIETWIRSDAQSRAVLNEVANWIDTNLRMDPELKGTVRPVGLRALQVPVNATKASVVYQVLPDDREVRVVQLIFRKWRNVTP